MARDRKYCVYHACIDCGEERWVYRYDILKDKSLRCKNCSAAFRGQRDRGEVHFAWKGGTHPTAEGYIMVTVPPGDFFSPMTQGKKATYVLEHRLVMAKHLNRCLLSWESVHHKNGVKNDNRLGNLELFPESRKHNGVSQLQKRIKQLETENEKLREQLAKFI